jgi:hypothetical protein
MVGGGSTATRVRLAGRRSTLSAAVASSPLGTIASTFEALSPRKRRRGGILLDVNWTVRNCPAFMRFLCYFLHFSYISSVRLCYFFRTIFFPDKIKWRLRHHPVVPYVMQRSPQHRYSTRGSQPVNSEVSPSRPLAPIIEAAADSSVGRKAKRQPDLRDTDDVRFAFSYILDHEFSKENGELLYTVS